LSQKSPGLLPDTLLLYGFTGVLLWAPLPLGSNRGWSSSLLILLISALFGLWALNQISPKAAGLKHSPNGGRTIRGVRPTRAALPLLVLMAITQGWVAIQLLLGISTNQGETFRALLLGVSYLMAFWLTIAVFNTRSRLTLLLGTLVVSGIVQAFFGAFMTLSGVEWLLFGPKVHYQEVVTGTFVNRNHLAGYLEMTLACGIGLMLASGGGGSLNWRNMTALLISPKFLTRLALAIMVIALVMSRSRMGNTAFFSSLLILGVLFIVAHKENRLRNGLILASLIAIDVLIISNYFGLEKLKDRIMATQLEDKVVAGEVLRKENVDRDDVAGYVMTMLENQPITGIGAGSFESNFQRYAGPDIRLDFDHAHNDYLQFIAERGVIGTLPLLLFVVLALWHGVRALWHQQSAFRSGVGTGAAMGILAILIHSFTDFNLQIPANALTFTVLCAIAVLANSHKRTDTKHRG
jgi:O-antigen ligase